MEVLCSLPPLFGHEAAHGGAQRAYPEKACPARYRSSSKLDNDLLLLLINPAHFFCETFSASSVRFLFVMNTFILCTRRISSTPNVRRFTRADIRSAVPSSFTSAFFRPSKPRFLHLTASFRMDSIITSEKALGTPRGPATDLKVDLKAPNGRKYTQPIGLFINNEWVESSNGQKLTTVNPTYKRTFWL